ncbi:MAG: acyl carrier protein [Anaerotignum sp.]|nr:acyl carrier protein [Anaerotignum sp.]
MMIKKVTFLLAEILGVAEEDITEQTEFTEEYGIEPIDVARLVIAVEKKFDITIYDDEAAAFQNVGDVISHINKVCESNEPS